MPEPDTKVALPKDACTISFIMYNNSNIEVVLDWPNHISDIKSMASDYAALISVLNYGGFKDDIKKILLTSKTQHSTNKNSDSYRFISYTLNRMAEAQKITELNSDKPIIGPRNVFAYNNKSI